MASAQSDRLNNLTLEDIIPKVVDTVNKSNVILQRIVSKPKAWNGRLVQEPITTTTSSLGQSFKGIETFDTAIDFTTQNLTWYATGYAQPVTISQVEQGFNNTPAGVISLYKASMEYAQNSMASNLGTIFYGTGTGNNFDGLGAIVDNGTLTSSYAGLSRATYGANINANVFAASAGVLSLDAMDAVDDASTVSGLNSETPNMILTTRQAWSLYGSLLEPTKMASYSVLGGGQIGSTTNIGVAPSAADGVTLRGGQSSLEYRAKPVIRDDKCPAGSMYFLNENYFEFRSLKIPGLNTVATTNTVTDGVYDKISISAFQFREPMSPVNQLAEVGIFVMYGNLICRQPNRNGLLTGITTT